MHIDYAREIYYKCKNAKFSNRDDLSILALLATDEIVDFASTLNDEKITSICETMKISDGYKNNSCFLVKKITKNQRYAVAKFLLEKFSSAKKVLAEVFSVKEQDVELTKKEIEYI